MLQNQFKFIATLGVVTVLLLSVNNSAAAQTIFKDSYEQVAAITSFSASVDAINQGESTTISWTTVGASACSPSGGAGDWDATVIDLPDGSAQIQINDSGNFTFTLTCVGIFGNLVLNRLGSQVKRDWIDVGKNRNCIDISRLIRRSDKGQRRCNDFISKTDPRLVQRKMKARSR